MLRETSRTREFWRISIEPSDAFDDWQKGKPPTGGARPSATRKTGEITIWHYCQGKVEQRPVGKLSADYGTIKWLA